MQYCQGDVPVFYFAVLVEAFHSNSDDVKGKLMSFDDDGVFDACDKPQLSTAALATATATTAVKNKTTTAILLEKNPSKLLGSSTKQSLSLQLQKEIAYHYRKMAIARGYKNEWEAKLMRAGLDPPPALAREYKQNIRDYTVEYNLHFDWLKENNPNFKTTYPNAKQEVKFSSGEE